MPYSNLATTAEIEVIALNTRSMSSINAVKESLLALEWLKKAGTKKFFFKYCSTFDSTSKGNIGPVAEALMNELKVNQSIYCPAFPENGRSIFMGNLFVGQKLLSESNMKDHPLTPMSDSNLMRLLGAQVTKRVGLADRMIVSEGSNALKEKLIELKENKITHVIIDAVADNGVLLWPGVARQRSAVAGDAQVLCARGGGGARCAVPAHRAHVYAVPRRSLRRADDGRDGASQPRPRRVARHQVLRIRRYSGYETVH